MKEALACGGPDYRMLKLLFEQAREEHDHSIPHSQATAPIEVHSKLVLGLIRNEHC
jgi:hypothetical protein